MYHNLTGEIISLNESTPGFPLVSIIVITYNSAKYIIETLESVRQQIYQNVELIITDDCSKDDTIGICKKWVEKNNARFIRAEIITSSKNTGIPANCNRGVKVAQGEWIKILAGDDILENDALYKVISFVKDKAYINVLDTQVEVFDDITSSCISVLNVSNYSFYNDKIDAATQFKFLVNNSKGNRLISTLGVYLKRSLIIDMNGFDERYRLLEDTPMWYKILHSGIKFYFLDQVTIKYRRHANNISMPANRQSHVKVISDFDQNVDQFIWDNLFKHLSVLNKLNVIWFRLITRLVIKLGNSGLVAHRIYLFGQWMQPIRLLTLKRAFSRLFL